MNRLDQLVNELCPNGVEYRALSEVGEFIRGKRFVKADMVEAGVPCIHYGEIYTKYGTSAKESISFVTEQRAKNLRFANPGDVIMASAGETIEDIGKSVAWLGTEPLAIHDACYAFNSSMDPVFVAHFFASYNFRSQIRQKISSSKISSISIQNVAKARIPVPPLEIQCEIARILDTFSELATDLAADLEMELEARQEQYEYYRHDLLSFNEGVEEVALGDIATIGTGSHDTKDAVENGEYVFYARGREPLRLDTFDFDETAIITAGDGVGVGKVFHYAEGQYALHQRAYRIVPNVGVDARFLYHYLGAHFRRYVERTSVHASVTSLRRPMLLNYPVALPSYEKQLHISSILDKFDTFINELSISLLAELVARRQQYEYYRDRLMTFKELKVPA